jgi:hypothetical protein
MGPYSEGAHLGAADNYYFCYEFCMLFAQENVFDSFILMLYELSKTFSATINVQKSSNPFFMERI